MKIKIFFLISCENSTFPFQMLMLFNQCFMILIRIDHSFGKINSTLSTISSFLQTVLAIFDGLNKKYGYSLATNQKNQSIKEVQKDLSTLAFTYWKGKSESCKQYQEKLF